MNRGLLTEGVDWWPPEALREEHVRATIAGGHADVVAANTMGWPDDVLTYADEGIDKVTRAVLGDRPLLLAHGHFHVAGETCVQLPGAAHETAVWSLAARRHGPGTVRVLDLGSLTDSQCGVSSGATTAPGSRSTT